MRALLMWFVHYVICITRHVLCNRHISTYVQVSLCISKFSLCIVLIKWYKLFMMGVCIPAPFTASLLPGMIVDEIHFYHTTIITDLIRPPLKSISQNFLIGFSLAICQMESGNPETRSFKMNPEIWGKWLSGVSQENLYYQSK